jgi:hypothetical protein
MLVSTSRRINLRLSLATLKACPASGRLYSSYSKASRFNLRSIFRYTFVLAVGGSIGVLSAKTNSHTVDKSTTGISDLGTIRYAKRSEFENGLKELVLLLGEDGT